ncbi:hypothetical protein ACSHT2_03400 [Bradyrhizobium sp. PUT101]|uniref:hypothetical protein n=1 Tax=Bradyrhizobium sp. PUT101 TaxID=3447427 RepID=UPI003F855F52
MNFAMVRRAIASLQIDADKNRREAWCYCELMRAKIAMVAIGDPYNLAVDKVVGAPVRPYWTGGLWLWAEH